MSANHPDVMILTAGYGDGHYQVSRALQRRFRYKGNENVQIIDLMKEAHPMLNTITRKLYQSSNLTSQYGFDFYGWSYYATRDAKSSSSLCKYFNFLGKRKLNELIQTARPDLIINTFPFGAAVEIGSRLSIPVCTVITDYTLHGRWIHPEMDRYYVAAEEMKTEMIARKALSPQQIKVTGIPVKAAFHKGARLRSRFKAVFNPYKDLVLIFAGYYSGHQQAEELANILLAEGNCQLAFVCGRNERMEQKLNAIYSGHPDVRVFGYVSQIEELMALASCVVTKAGGITLSEALALALPVFVYRPFSGQEKENAQYFAHKGMAQIASSIRELGKQIVAFLGSPDAAAAMKQRMAGHSCGDAAELIVEDATELVNRNMQLSI